MFNIDEETFNMHNRSACESGWDFSSRWFKDGLRKESNIAAYIIPVDLNCLIYFLEDFLSQIYREQNQNDLTKKFEELSMKRKELIRDLFWSEKDRFFMDYDRIENCRREIFSLAGVYPLYFGIATKEQAQGVYQRLRDQFVFQGGVVTTLHQTNQQWDYPNGWAPLQWITFKALKNYAFHHLANEIRSRWINLNDKIYQQTGQMIEKYNVVQHTEGGGGYYPSQDGFGWTNGVYLKLINTP